MDEFVPSNHLVGPGRKVNALETRMLFAGVAFSVVHERGKKHSSGVLL
jgi:hypothetical protein